MGGHFTFLGNLHTFHKGPPFIFHTHNNRSLHIVRPLNRGKNSTLPLFIALGGHLLIDVSMGLTYHLTSFLFKLMVDGITTNYACSMYTLEKGINFLYYVESK
jgi:hypothetical protein